MARHRTALAAAALLTLMASLAPQAGLSAQEAPLRKFSWPVAVGDTRYELELYAASEAEARAQTDKLEQTLRQRQQELGQARRLAAAARKGTVNLAPELYGLLDKLRSVCQLSQGAFDPTDMPLRTLWGFIPGALAYHLPKPEEILAAKAAVDCAQIELKPIPPSLFLANPRLELNWDLFAAGWLVDQGISVLNNLPAAMLKSGQVAYYHGTPPDAPAWKVPVPDPRHPEETLSYLYLKDQALTILGDYQNYFLRNGIRYSSLLDARTGYPTRENVAVQVTAPTALDAQLIAHAAAVLDDRGTQDLLKALQRSNVYKIVDRNGILLPLSY